MERLNRGTRARRGMGNRRMLEQLESRLLLTVITVTSNADAGTGSLRAAIAQANLDVQLDTIQFNPNVKLINVLTELPMIEDPLEIIGGGKVTINGGNKTRILRINDTTGANIAVTLNGLTLKGGKAVGNGGAIFNLEDLSLINVTITKNAASGTGGGIHSGDGVVTGSLTITNSIISDNKATLDGGGIYMRVGALSITNSTISGNSAVNGGGLWSDGADVDAADYLVLKNKGSGDGGGIYYAGTGHLELFDGTMDSNTAGGQGGGVFCDGELSVIDSILKKNVATGEGGGVYQSGDVLEIESSTFTANFSVKGGAVWSDGTAFTAEDVLFDLNKSTLDGGAFHYTGTGGGDIVAGLFDTNSSGNDGGAIFFDSPGVLNLNGLTFDSNSALGNGGAIVLLDAAPSTWEELRFLLNKAKENGGGAFVQDSAGLQILDIILRENSATLDGGGFWSDGTPITAENWVVFANKAGDRGGGLFLDNDTLLEDMEFIGCDISQNTAFNGGGTFAAGGNVIVERALYFGNSAKSDAGGIFNQAKFNMRNSTLANNSAAEFAGAFINFTGGDATLESNTIANNKAGTGQGGGLLNYFSASVVLYNNIISGNTRGAKIASDVQVAQGFPVDALSANNLIGDPNVGQIGLAGNTNNIIGEDPELGPLGNYGGPTRTFAIPLGSPAIDTGINFSSLLDDQRGPGFDRVVNGTIDIGAFENEFAADFVRQVSVTSSQSRQYLDALGHPVTVAVTGPGSAHLFFDTAGPNENPPLVQVYNTTSKSKLKFSLGAGLATGIGDMNVFDSIGEVNMLPVELGGSAHFNGVPTKIIFGDVEDDHEILIDGEGMTSKSVVSIVLGFVAETTITSAVPISLLQVVRWDDDGGVADMITAPRLDKLVVTGSKTPLFAGDFEASMFITGAGQPTNKPVLGTVTIAGTLGGGATRASWEITGSVGTMTVAKMLDADVAVSNFFKSLTVKAAAGVGTPVFVNSNVSVEGTLLSAKLGKVQTDNTANGGVDFGVAGGALGPVEYVNALGTKVTVKSPTNPPPVTDEDFFVVFIV